MNTYFFIHRTSWIITRLKICFICNNKCETGSNFVFLRTLRGEYLVLANLYFYFFFILFLQKKLHILQLDWPADSNASLGGPVDQLLQTGAPVTNYLFIIITIIRFISINIIPSELPNSPLQKRESTGASFLY